MLNLIAWILVGALAGWAAGFIVKSEGSLLTNIFVGMLGSLIGGAIVTLVNTGRLDLLNTSFNNFDLTSFLVSLLGSVVLLVLLRMIRNQ